MTSKETHYRKVRMMALERILIKVVKLLTLKKKDLGKIPLKFLVNIEMELDGYVLPTNYPDRYVYERHISPNDVDSVKRCLRKS